MSVVSARKLWFDRDGEAEATGPRRYTESWRVVTDYKYDGVVTVGAGFTSFTGVGYGSTYHEDSSAWLQKIHCKNESFSPYVWIVTCNYSTERETSADPTIEPAIITWGGEQFQKPAVYDRNGDAIVNSAGEFFEDPPQMDDSRITAQIQKNVAAVPSWILTYKDAVNQSVFTLDGISIGVEVAKLQPPSIGQEQSRGGYAFRQLTLNMHFNPDTWALSILDRGYNEIDPDAPTKRKKILDNDGLEPTVPQLLNGLGRKLNNPNLSNAVFLSKDVYNLRDFTVLPLT